MKRNLLLLGLVGLALSGIYFNNYQSSISFAAPVSNLFRSLIPETDNQFYIGTTSPSNLRYKALILATTTAGCATFAASGEIYSVGTTCGSGVGGGGSDPFTHPTAGVSATTSSLIVNNATSTISNLDMVNSTSTNATSTTFSTTIASTTNLIVSGFTLGSIPIISTAGRFIQDNARFFWDVGTGRLGIGTNVPDVRLHVVGTPTTGSAGANTILEIENNNDADFTIKSKNDKSGSVSFASSNGSTQGQLFYTHSTNNMGLTSAGQIIFSTAIGAAMNIASNGNIGIGTDTPYAKLSVVGPSGVVAAKYTATTTASSVFPYASTTAVSASEVCLTGDVCRNTWPVSGASSANSKWATSTTDVNAIFLNAALHAGIGTTTPWADLAVNPVAGDANSFVIGSSTATRFLVDNRGFVGIGTAAPATKLHVSGGDIRLSDTNVLGWGAGASAKIGGSDSSDFITFTTNNIEAGRFVTTQNFGLGTTTPNWPIHIATTSASDTFLGQLALTDMNGGTDAKHWTLRSVNGRFELGSSSDAFATTTLFSITDASTTFSKALFSSSAATSSLANGLNLTAGCFAVAGTCISGSGSAGTSAFEVATETNIAVSGLAYITKTSGRTTIGSTATGTLSASSPLSLDGTTVIVGTSRTLSLGTVGVANGGTGQTVFGQGWLSSDGTNITASTSPTVNYITATSTTGKNLFWGNLALSTSSPWAQLAVNPVAGQASNQFVVGSSSATNFIVDNRGFVGVGTTTPGATFSVQGNALISGNMTNTNSTTTGWLNSLNLNVTNATTTTLSIGTLSGTLFGVSGVVTATTALAVNNGGTGVSSYGQGWIFSPGAASALAASTSPTVNYIVATSTTGKNQFWGNTGISTGTPAAMLAVNPIAGQALNAFVVGSSTGTSLIVTNDARVGVGTSSPITAFAVEGTTTIHGRVISMGPVDCGAGGLKQLSLQGLEYCGNDNSDDEGVQIIAGNTNGGAKAWTGLTLNNSEADASLTHFFGMYYNSPAYTSTFFGTAYGNKRQAIIQNTDGLLSLISSTGTRALNDTGINFLVGGSNTENEAMRLTLERNLTVGTTSAFGLVTLATSSANKTFRGQLTLTDNSGAANKKHWMFAVANGNLTISTSTDVLATSSPAAVQFLSTGTGLLVGTTSNASATGLAVAGTGYWSGLTASAGLQTGILCLSSVNEIINESVACVASAARWKHLIESMSSNEAYDKIMRLRPVSFYWKPDFNGSLQGNPNYNGQQIGLIADEVVQVDKRLVNVEIATTTFEGIEYAPGTVHGVNYNEVTAMLVSAFQTQTRDKNWQWAVIMLLFVAVSWQQYQIYTLKRK